MGAGGCGTFVTETPINEAPRPLEPRPPESVEIFTSAPPARPHVDVMLLEVEQTHDVNDQGMDIMIARLRERAGQLGCDAVFIGGFSEHEGQHGNFLDKDSTKMQATCIAYTDLAPSLPPPPGR